MRTESTSNHTIVFYDSIHELPADRDNMINYYLLEDTGIGTDMHGVGSLLSSINIAARNNNPKDIEQAIFNIIQGIWSQIDQYRPDHMAWACFIKSIDEIPFVDLSRDNVTKTVKMLSEDGLTIGQLEETVEGLKKKFPESWNTISQNGQELENEKEYYSDI